MAEWSGTGLPNQLRAFDSRYSHLAPKLFRKQAWMPSRRAQFDSGWAHLDVSIWRSVPSAKRRPRGSIPRHVSLLSLPDSTAPSKRTWAGSTPAESTSFRSASGPGILTLNQATRVRVPHGTQRLDIRDMSAVTTPADPGFWLRFRCGPVLTYSSTLRAGPRESLARSQAWQAGSRKIVTMDRNAHVSA